MSQDDAQGRDAGDGRGGGKGNVVTISYRRFADQTAATRRVADHLRAGGVIAYPTETVYGFGCLPEPVSLDGLSRLKGRDPAKPFLLLVRSVEDVPELTWTPLARFLAERFWPGPLTLVLDDPDDRFPPGVRGPDGKVAVRVSPFPAVATILHAAAGPITSTSANRPGAEPARDGATAAAEAEALVARAGGGIPVLVLNGGPLSHSPPSTILDCTAEPPRIVRAGALRLDTLRQMAELEGP